MGPLNCLDHITVRSIPLPEGSKIHHPCQKVSGLVDPLWESALSRDEFHMNTAQNEQGLRPANVSLNPNYGNSTWMNIVWIRALSKEMPPELTGVQRL